MNEIELLNQLNEARILNLALVSTAILMIVIAFFSLRFAVRKETYFNLLREDKDLREYVRQKNDPRLQEQIWEEVFGSMETATLELMKNPDLFPNPIDSEMIQLTYKYTIIENGK